MTDTLDTRLRRFSNINLAIYDTLVARGLSKAEAERWAELEPRLRLPHLYHALIEAGTCPELAHAAVEEVADYADRQRHPLTAIGQTLRGWA
jgi:hypothetical protein